MSAGMVFALVMSAVIVGIIFMVAKTGAISYTPSICPSCGTQGRPRTETRGSIFIEIILWFCFIIPGLIYTIWRLTTRHKVCRACRSNVIPISSPRGQQLVREAAGR